MQANAGKYNAWTSWKRKTMMNKIRMIRKCCRTVIPRKWPGTNSRQAPSIRCPKDAALRNAGSFAGYRVDSADPRKLTQSAAWTNSHIMLEESDTQFSIRTKNRARLIHLDQAVRKIGHTPNERTRKT